jgi:hypothetical protein
LTSLKGFNAEESKPTGKYYWLQSNHFDWTPTSLKIGINIFQYAKIYLVNARTTLALPKPV